jgi:DNA mismatch endonuclease (patch repair protein)
MVKYGTMKIRSRVPSFNGLRPASKTSSQVKQRNHSHGTQHEVLLRGQLRRLGLRFRQNLGSLPGKPDFVFGNARLVVFCDGDFWHGRNWKQLKKKLKDGANAEYWCAKIASNIRRDRKNTVLLKKQGWEVVRLWESETKRHPHSAAQKIFNMLKATH